MELETSEKASESQPITESSNSLQSQFTYPGDEGYKPVLDEPTIGQLGSMTLNSHSLSDPYPGPSFSSHRPDQGRSGFGPSLQSGRGNFMTVGNCLYTYIGSYPT